MQSNNLVHGLWIKGTLSPLELLTIYSFIDQGYTFHLWTYDSPHVYPSLPQLKVRDAREIIPEEKVFSYKYSNQFGHGKGSYAGFSDIFRYRLLYLFGGWWVDMDVTCLSKLEFESPYVFRRSKENNNFIVGNIMYVPPNSELMKICFEQASIQVTSDNTDWMLPINILNENIKKLGLHQYTYSFSNEDSWPVVSPLLCHQEVSKSWKAIHWMNEEFRRIGISKIDYLPYSFLGHLYNRYQLGRPIQSLIPTIQYTFKTGRVYYALIHFRRETFLSSLYYFGYNLFYFVSDIYFLKIKPRWDIGKLWRRSP